MYDIYFGGTRNGYKVLLFAEKAEISYAIKPVNIGKGQQFAPVFLKDGLAWAQIKFFARASQ